MEMNPLLNVYLDENGLIMQLPGRRQNSFNDPATLRRLLFGTGLMDRTLDGREYWRV